ncbi:hypothetical protein [Cupriavidus oxalaticus]|uniref:Uncharacterized protein n=1 Tax=Cupriavidus oxalaticus TaxID=96344 RepID=A0A4P7LAN6_9BURK|nr:hypothetical protein [Cupriavidus oxalaticus]QBY52535.1 hypothetical protein E0W60_15200 [Cupriavidus oxalaticus]QEZ46011.1 hypothetical protein D2917_17080 [Cupriavidus oxalaticus]
MSKDDRKKARQEALRREGWELKNHLQDVEYDAVSDILDEMEACGIDDDTVQDMRFFLHDILKGVVTEVVEAMTGPQRPIQRTPSKGEREHRMTPAKVTDWRKRIVAAYHRMKTASPSRRVSMEAAIRAAIAQAEDDGVQPFSAKVLREQVMAIEPWPPS